MSHEKKIALLHEFVNEQKRALYQFKKELGLCIERNCKAEATEAVRCESHQARARVAIKRVQARYRKQG